MARAARKMKADDDAGVIPKKDFAHAKKLYFDDIKTAQSQAATHMQEISEAYKAIKKVGKIQPGAAKAAFKLFEMEDAKRDDWLRCFQGLLVELGIELKPDLVDAMGATKVRKPIVQLVTVSDGIDADLAGAADDETAAEDF